MLISRRFQKPGGDWEKIKERTVIKHTGRNGLNHSGRSGVEKWYDGMADN